MIHHLTVAIVTLLQKQLSGLKIQASPLDSVPELPAVGI